MNIEEQKKLLEQIKSRISQSQQLITQQQTAIQELYREQLKIEGRIEALESMRKGDE